MPFNLDTVDYSYRELSPKHSTQTYHSSFTTEVTIKTNDPITQAVIHDRIMVAIDNLGDEAEVHVDVSAITKSHLDNLDF